MDLSYLNVALKEEQILTANNLKGMTIFNARFFFFTLSIGLSVKITTKSLKISIL